MNLNAKHNKKAFQYAMSRETLTKTKPRLRQIKESIYQYCNRAMHAATKTKLHKSRQ